MKKVLVEICAGSVTDCVEAKMGGADRVELNSALSLGGLTATLGTLSLTKENCPGLPIVSMVRPRGGGFYYSNFEYETMKRDARELLKNGSDGIVFGFLNEDKTVDEYRTKTLTAMAHEYGKVAVFHRAFDCVPNRDDAMDILIDAGIDRVLTSGGEVTSYEGMEEIARLINVYSDEIQILPGAGIRLNNVLEIIEKTGTTQIHSSCRNWFIDPTSENGTVLFNVDDAHPGAYDGSDTQQIKELVNLVSKGA